MKKHLGANCQQIVLTYQTNHPWHTFSCLSFSQFKRMLNKHLQKDLWYYRNTSVVLEVSRVLIPGTYNPLIHVANWAYKHWNK